MFRKTAILQANRTNESTNSPKKPTTGFSSRESLNDANWFPVSEARNSGHNYSRWSANNNAIAKSNNLEENDSLCDYYDPYPQWSSKHELPIQRDEIESIFLQLMDMFGFQLDSTRNMYDYLLRLLDSRASRMSPSQALRTLHADYIGGINANFKKWYFAAQLDIDDSFGFKNVKIGRTSRSSRKKSILSLEQAENQWYANMTKLSPTDCTVQLALYLLCWGEANNIRFLPECLCFIFKCCNDYYYSASNDTLASSNCGTFLEHTITPLYEFYRNQSYSLKNGHYQHKRLDHSATIGYDDMNQLFWHRQGLERLVLSDNKTRLMHLPPNERYPRLNEVLWKKAFYKTFKETRSWSHVVTNFSRVWIIHIAIYWLYTMFNLPSLYCKDYKISLDNQPTNQARLTVLSIAGTLATIVSLLSTIFEFTFVPRKWAGAQGLFKRTIGLLLFLILNTGPTIYLFSIYPLDVQTTSGLTISVFQFLFSIFSVVYLTTKPLGRSFDSRSATKRHDVFANKVFTANFHPLKGIAKVTSYALWIAIFISKFVESYFFLTLSLRDPIRELSVMKLEFCAGEVWFGSRLCYYQGLILMILIYLTDLVLFCLDTYLWYIIWNTIFSVGRSFYVGISIWTPWRNIFSNLPKRIYSKIIVTSGGKKVKAKVLVSQVWNSVIISMYREHLLSLEHVHKLIYKEIIAPGSEGGSVLSEPSFFVSCEDQSVKSALFHERSEAQRRITFFAQSLSTPMPEIGAIECVPCFTVLIPHYSEKIMLSLKEIIREEDQLSHVTMLEYLKSLFPLEWSCFVKDTKMLAEEYDSDETITEQPGKQQSDIPYASVGFKIASPEYILRTRIWASLRTQTLYRTISGFMNYSRAIKLLLDVENSESNEILDEENRLEAAAVMAHRKFRIVTSMQRYNRFNFEEMENTEFLLRAYPELQISYLEEEIESETGNINYYSVLIDGTCSINSDGSRRPKYRIKLSGDPILGDGKSDNQNHSIVFGRGEYIQLIDANQDNYIEECLKIRSILAEFEETSLPPDPYSNELKDKDYSYPVAIVGTREYIFSENFGILGDVAAGKEQTFGTLFARTLAEVGGKLHYGHPDFLNSIYMTTRGGVSKAQKGLHLNEDIYAGMNVLLRGGRIKQCEYIQCGKGRDLGFGSISNFTTKIGAGMGEQMISREYFYLGTQLPLDRFLSFYYAHPGFHLNNVIIILSLKLLLLVAINLAALTNGATICEYDKNRPITDPRRPLGCYNLVPVVHWLQRCILSIFIVFLISFLPLGVQELTERGFYKMVSRLGKQFASFSPLFEVFICRLYANSLSSDIAVGGAKYIATGRGLATVRVPFNVLYSRYASESLYFGSISAVLILYASISMWQYYLLYFWITIFGLVICPFLFNPNQFSFVEFFLDYGKYLKWLYNGTSQSAVNSWISYTRLRRSKLVGVKIRKFEPSNDVKYVNNIKPSILSLLSTYFLSEFIILLVITIAYTFANSQNKEGRSLPVNSLLRLLIVSFVPIGINIVVLVLFFVVSIFLGPPITFIFHGFPSVISFIVLSFSVVNHVVFFEILWFLQRWDFSKTLLGFAASISLQKSFFTLLNILFLSKEFDHDKSTRAWWSGKWVWAGLGWKVLTQPFREFICKITELSYFTADVFLGHAILIAQFPLILIPYADKWHSLMLFWLKPSTQRRPTCFTRKQRKYRVMRVILNASMFLFAIILFSCIFIFPFIMKDMLEIDLYLYAPEILEDYDLIQPMSL